MTLILHGQATDPGAEIKEGEKILPNKREEDRDAGGISRRANKKQELEELATDTTAEIQGCYHPRLQTSKPRREGSMCA